MVVLCWRAFLVEHRHWINHLMEFQLEFLLDHMLVISFWYVLLVEPSSCNLHEGTLVYLIQGGLLITPEGYFQLRCQSISFVEKNKSASKKSNPFEFFMIVSTF